MISMAALKSHIKNSVIFAFLAILLAHSLIAAEKLTIPPCPADSTLVSYPSQFHPRWTACQDSQGLLQGMLIQYTEQQEIIRIAHLKDSKRHGKEIRAGASGTLEEREYKKGHLQNRSYIFKTDSILGRLLPKPINIDTWNEFSNPKPESYLQSLTKSQPVSITHYENGRLVRAQGGKKDFRFRVSEDGRIFSENHPEMKGLFFLDPEALWVLDADDLKRALLPGFGSCKKYSGPIGRLTRHYDSLLYKRENSEKKHTDKYEDMIQRFLNYCVPKDLTEMLGVLECPPQLPSPRPAHTCWVGVSDQLRMPYYPKFFKFKLTAKRSPEALVALLESKGLQKFLGSHDQSLWEITLSPNEELQLKKTPRGVFFKILDRKEKSNFGFSQDWWTWHRLPAH